MKAVIITSSLLIAVVLLLRWLFRGKVSQRLIYGAWLLVALRLLIPIQFGQSLFSVATLTQQVESRSEPIQQFQQALKDPVSGPSRDELYDQLVNDYLQSNPAPEMPETPDTPVTPDAPAVPDKPVTLTPQVQQSIKAQPVRYFHRSMDRGYLRHGRLVFGCQSTFPQQSQKECRFCRK